MNASGSIQKVFVSIIGCGAAAIVAQAQSSALLYEETLLHLSDPGYHTFFGTSVAITDGYAFVGAPHFRDESNSLGAVFVYRQSGGTWSQSDILFAQGPAPSLAFGYSIAVSGDWLVVGAPYDLTSNPGQAYFFHHEGSAWVWRQAILSPPSSNPSGFGAVVAINGNTAVISREFGAVYVYALTGGSWFPDGTISGWPEDICNDLPISLSTDSDRIAVGLPCQRQVVVYHHMGNQWVLEQTIPEDPPMPDDMFGRSVSIDGNTLLIGAAWDISAYPQPGRAYVYNLNAGSWSKTQTLMASDNANDDGFGGSVALENDTCLIGAYGVNGQEAFDGAGYLFRRCNGHWVEERKLLASQPQFSDLLGLHAAIHDGRGILGSRGSETEGSACIFRLDEDCNHNQSFDACDVDSGGSADCNGNHRPDECEPQADCNGNSTQDICDIASGHSHDCDADQVPDECELVPDCNGNSVPDRCDLNSGTSRDCQHNGIPDECDIASGDSLDTDHNGVPDECEQPACVPDCVGPCVSLKAIAVNDSPMPSNNCVWAHPGDVVMAEFSLSNWNEVLPDGLRAYQISSFIFQGALSGTFGQVLPFDYDRPVPDVHCNSPADCPLHFPVCASFQLCQNPNKDPNLGEYIDFARPDFVFGGQTVVGGVALGGPGYRTMYAAAPFNPYLAIDDGGHSYAGTLKLLPAPSACGTFAFNIEHANTFFYQLGDPHDYVFPDTQPLIVHVCEDDGIYCNGQESCDAQTGCVIQEVNCDDGVACTLDSCNEVARTCDHTPSDAFCDDGDRCTLDKCTPTGCTHMNICGSCCNLTTGLCASSQLAGECTCPHCHWTPGASCDEANCTQVFAPIPTVSAWGGVVLALLLATAAKLRFGRSADAA